MWAMVFCVVASVLTVSIGTIDSFKRRLSKCEYLDYFRNTQNRKNNDSTRDQPDCLKDQPSDKHESNSSSYKKIMLYDSLESFVIIDSILLFIFSVELLLRLFTCPSLKLYMRDALNVIDIVILLATLIEITFRYSSKKYRYIDKGLHLLYYIQMIRVLRILRYVRGFPSIQVLVYTLKSNYKDIFVMILYICIGVTLFANFLYFAEDKENIDNIPMAWWWGIITMTTVGYGDVVPKTTVGRIIGGLCALSGVFVFSLIIPVFVNTFITFYRFSHLHKRFLKRIPARLKIEPLNQEDDKMKY